jgi:F-type H+-transporting ATPase subunit b
MLKRMVLIIAVALWLAMPVTSRAAEAPAEAGHVAQAEAGEHEKPGDLMPNPGDRNVQLQAMWTIIIFIVLLVVLYPTAWRNVLVGLKKREERIRGDIADAEAARKRAEETLGKYNQQLSAAEGQVRDIIAKASSDAEKIATSMRMQAQQEAEEIKERANREIESARKTAVADIYAQAADLSTKIAEKILRRELNANDQRELVNRSLEQLQTAGKL